MSPTFITSTRRPSARNRASRRCGKASSGRVSAPKVTLSPRIATRACPSGFSRVRVRSRRPSRLNSSQGGQPAASDFIT